MATLKELYKLVQSLDKNEKKNLSMMISSMGGKAKLRYAHSLKIINEQKEFDAEVLKKKLSADVSGMNLTEANDYFFTFVCKTLVSQQTTVNGNLGLLKDLTLVEILISKGLFDIADKFLQPLLIKLNRGNSFGLLSRGQELNSIVIASNEASKLDFKKRMEMIEARSKTARNHLQYLEIMRVNHRLSEIIQTTGDPRQKSHLIPYETVYKDPIWSTSYSEVSIQAFTMYAPLKTDILGMIRGHKEAITECKMALEEFYKRFNVVDHYVVAFYLLDNLISNYIREQDAKAIAPIIFELQNLLPYAKHKAVHQKILAKIMFSELCLEIIRGNYSAGIQRLDHWMKQPQKASWEEAPLAYMNYLLGARLHYLNNNPDKALDYLFNLRSIEKTFRASMLLTYRFLVLLCYYKLNNLSLITSTADSITKSLRKQETLYAPERALLRFVKSSGTVEKMKSNMKTLYDTLIDLKKDPLSVPFFQYGDYLEWLKMEIGKNNSRNK